MRTSSKKKEAVGSALHSFHAKLACVSLPVRSDAWFLLTHRPRARHRCSSGWHRRLLAALVSTATASSEGDMYTDCCCLAAVVAVLPRLSILFAKRGSRLKEGMKNIVNNEY